VKFEIYLDMKGCGEYWQGYGGILGKHHLHRSPNNETDFGSPIHAMALRILSCFLGSP